MSSAWLGKAGPFREAGDGGCVARMRAPRPGVSLLAGADGLSVALVLLLASPVLTCPVWFEPTAAAQTVVPDSGSTPGYLQPQGRWMKKIAPVKPTPADAALSAYISRVHADYGLVGPTTGSLWTANGRLAQLGIDAKARNVHDVISVVVSEALSASTDGSVKNSRASSATSAISALFGSLTVSNRLQNLLNASAASALNAQGQSVSNSSLSTVLGGEVMDVLPNGMLVIQAVRQVTFSQQTQTIRLRGVVRPEDVTGANQVPSAAITNLELEVTGKGIINDYTYRPNLIVRILQRLLVF